MPTEKHHINYLNLLKWVVLVQITTIVMTTIIIIIIITPLFNGRRDRNLTCNLSLAEDFKSAMFTYFITRPYLTDSRFIN